jgi:hypothetical protein
VGVVLATQNPVDLDYKGLANAGTWLIGRLQTERDKMRVIEGLESALAGGADNLDRAAIDRLLSNLTSRVFLMRNVHDDRPVLFQSRWALSYLRGPLTLAEIRTLMSARRQVASAPAVAPAGATPAAATGARPPIGGEINEQFLRSTAGAAPFYQPRIAGITRLHFVDARAGIDSWRETAYVAPLSLDGQEVLWNESSTLDDFRTRFEAAPAANARYAEPPAAATRAASYRAWGKSLEAHLYQHARLEVLTCEELELSSRAGESEGDFRARLSQALREKRDDAVADLRARYQPRLATLQDRIRRAEERVAREQSQYSQQKMQSAISIGATVLGALLGSRRISSGTLGRATTAARSAGRMGREKEDVDRAAEGAEVLKQRLTALAAECEQEVTALQAKLDPQAIAIRRTHVGARKSDIEVTRVLLLWVPQSSGG